MELQTVDLASVGTDEKKPVEFAGQPRLVILDNHPSVELRLNQRGAPALPAVRGDEYCLEEGIGKVYVTNPLQVEADLRLLVLRQDEVATLESEAGVNGGGSIASKSAEKLTGNLAEGETISPGEELAETVDVSGADIVRVRAQVDGMTSFSEVDSQAVSGMAMYLDESRDRLYVGLKNSAEFREYDVSNPDLPLQVGSINLSTSNGNLSHFVGFGFDSQQQKIVTVGYDGTDTVVVTVDVSTLGSPSQTGDAVLAAGTDDVAFDDPIRWPVHEKSGRAVLNTDGETVHKVDISGATPVVEASNLPVTRDPSQARCWQDRDIIFYINDRNGFGDMALVVLEFSNNGTHSEAQHGIPGDECSTLSLFHIDPEREVVFWMQQAGTNTLRMLDVSDPHNPRQLDTASGTSYLQNNTSLNVGWLDSHHAEDLMIFGTDFDFEFGVFRFVDGTLEQIEHMDISSSDQHKGRELWHPNGGNLRIYTFDDSGQLETWTVTEGAVDLQIVPLFPNGDRVATGVSSVVTLRSGVESLLDLDLVGEEEVDVVLTHQGSQQGTIQRVVQTQEVV